MSTPAAGVRLGVVGVAGGAVVDASGGVRRDDGLGLAWRIGAADRWHAPAEEPSLRQRRVADMPVVETALRVPGGDALVRAYAVADHGGLVVLEVENASPQPFAIAVEPDAPVLLGASRPPSTVPAGGVDLAPGASTWPVAHRTTLQVVLPLAPGRAVPSPGRLPDAEVVARGWALQSERVLRADVPDEALTAQLRAGRADVLLDDDPAARLLLAASPEEVAAAVHALGKRTGRGRAAVVRAGDAWALAAAALVLEAAGEPRAASDVRRTLASLPSLPSTGSPGAAGPSRSPVAALSAVRDRLLREHADGVELLPDLDPSWLGGAVEAHEVATRHGRVGVALRWHGARPALLWECDRPIRLTCPSLDPGWSDERARGEALLAGPAVVASTAAAATSATAAAATSTAATVPPGSVPPELPDPGASFS